MRSTARRAKMLGFALYAKLELQSVIVLPAVEG
jgi:hypothetical protein